MKDHAGNSCFILFLTSQSNMYIFFIHIYIYIYIQKKWIIYSQKIHVDKKMVIFEKRFGWQIPRSRNETGCRGGQLVALLIASCQAWMLEFYYNIAIFSSSTLGGWCTISMRMLKQYLVGSVKTQFLAFTFTCGCCSFRQWAQTTGNIFGII